ncbi:hypothetical protein EXIGLDRAFT_828817 [Exidia glandulosa HHB12029]|uniref:DUF6533 domain-containing protein n=1 Tax=Exidia glandulosa HHB12029 TaxID=1314781 RepID=A0A165Q4D5_EXIGL|nr:hypothetical protein EXIGLDRAFT_828817 [Exidia glandulosa HHB12029]
MASTGDSSLHTSMSVCRLSNRGLISVSNTRAAMYALVVYDWLNCFGDELSLVKTPGVSPAKLAYLFCRYWPLATYPVGLWVDVPDHTHELCEKIFRLPLILQVLNFTGPALVISIRVHAFTGRSTSLSVLLTACLVIFTLYQFWVMTTQAALNPQFGCFPVDVGPAKHLAGHFLAPLLFDCIAILIVIVHAIRTIPFHLWSASTITRVFITDGVYYFVMILYLHVFNAFMSFQPDRAISGVGVPLDLLLPSILACRLVLNLRRAVLQDPDVPSNDKFGDRSSLTAFKAKTVETKMLDGTAVMIESWPTDDSHPSQPGFDPIPLLISAVQFSRITRYFHVGTYSVAIYDWLLCLRHEIDLLATPGVSPAKVTYLLSRYWPLIAHIVTMWVQITDHPVDVCARTFKAALFVVIPSFAFAASVLTARIYAFTGCNRAIAGGLAACMLVVSTYQTWALVTQVTLVPFGDGCYPVERPGSSAKHLSGFFFAPLVFDSDCLATAIFACCAVTILKFRFAQASTFTRVFIREGAAYFVAISAVNLTNAAMSFQPNVAISGVIVPLSMLFPNILACRLVLNLRSAVSESANLNPPSGLAASTNVHFQPKVASTSSTSRNRHSGPLFADESFITMEDSTLAERPGTGNRDVDVEMLPRRSTSSRWPDHQRDDRTWV